MLEGEDVIRPGSSLVVPKAAPMHMCISGGARIDEAKLGVTISALRCHWMYAMILASRLRDEICSRRILSGSSL